MRIATLTAVLAATASLMAGAITSNAAAEGKEIGAILLSGEAFPVLFTASNEGGRLETISKKSIQCIKEEGSGTIESATTGKATDDLTGCKKESINCRSENSKGEKDPIETVLIQNLKGVFFTMKTSSGELAAGISDILSETLTVLCSLVKIQIRGNVSGLATPTLTQIPAGSPISFQSKEKEGRPITGTCIEPKETCEAIAANPLEANLGKGFEGAGTELSATVLLAKMALIED